MSEALLIDLKRACAATRFGGGARTVATRLGTQGVEFIDRLLTGLGGDDASQVHETAARLHARGVEALLLGSARYPARLAASRSAPPVLFVNGPHSLLNDRAVGFCGSRRATDSGLRAAHACAEAATAHGATVVSGYAQGVDLAAHTSALAAGGSTVIVLPEGIERFTVRRGLTQLWDPDRTLVVSQFAPGQPWSAGGAMARNAVISGLSNALVVVEAGETGGTLAAGMHALERGQPVLVIETAADARGSRVLVSKGASSIPDRAALGRALARLTEATPPQLTLL